MFGTVPWSRLNTPDPLQGWFPETDAIRAGDALLGGMGYSNIPLALTFPTNDKGWDLEYTFPQEKVSVHVDGQGNPTRTTK